MESNEVGPDTVRHVANLARLEIEQEQLEANAGQLGQILAYVDQLQSASIPETVKPFFGPIEPTSMAQNAVRTDEVIKSRERDEMLHNAPHSDGEFYCVPPVFHKSKEK